MTATQEAVRTIKCSFECPDVINANLVYESNTLNTRWHALHSYYLYVFIKRQSREYFLCWPSDDEPARSSDTSDPGGLYKCTFEFTRGETYYCYFSGRKLTVSEIESLRIEKNCSLIEITPAGAGRIRIQQSFFVFMHMVQVIVEKLSSCELLLETLLKVYSGEINDINGVDNDITDWIKRNNIISLPEDTVVDMRYVLQGISAFLKGETALWQSLIELSKQEAISLKENPQNSRMGAIYALESAWDDAAAKVAPPLKLISAMHGFMLCRKYGSELSQNILTLFSKFFESYFYNPNRDKEMSEYLSNISGN